MVLERRRLGSVRPVQSITRLKIIHVKVVVSAQESASGLSVTISTRGDTLPQMVVHTNFDAFLFAGSTASMLVHISITVERVAEVTLLIESAHTVVIGV